jgi:hypothetical protein
MSSLIQNESASKQPSVNDGVSSDVSSSSTEMGFKDNRIKAISRKKIAEQSKVHAEDGSTAQLKKSTNHFNTSSNEPIQQRKGQSNLPDHVKSGVENLSGVSMDDVKVHYNSDKPAQLQAHAYAQGTDIHVAAGQEKHIPHEAWHVVQQKQGRVKPTKQLKEKVAINDNDALEREADVMGAKALQLGAYGKQPIQQKVLNKPIIQREEIIGGAQEQALAPQVQVQANDHTNRDDERRMGAEALVRIQAKVQAATTLAEELMIIPSVKGNAAKKNREKLIGAIQDLIANLENGDDIANALESANLIATATDEQMDAVIGNANLIAVGEESLISFYQEVVRLANPAAHIAVEAGSPEIAAAIMITANKANERTSDRSLAFFIDDSIGQIRGRKRDGVSTVFDYADGVNNVGGVAGGTAGIVEAAGVSGASGGAVVGYLGGILGIIFGTLGTLLALYGLISGLVKKSRLNAIAPAITDDEMVETLSYAQAQTDTASARAGVAIGAGLTAVTAGVLGVLAVTAVALGPAAIGVGIAAAVIGLGFVAFKYIHKVNKRKAERLAFAETMVNEVQNIDSPYFSEYAEVMMKNGLNPEDARGTADKREALITKLSDHVGDMIKTKRQEYAEGILDALVNGQPSQQFEAELILSALGREPDKVRKAIAEDDVATQISRVMGSLSSW